MKLAAQFYTLREFTTTAEGLRDALRRCKDMGYEGVQLSAVGAMNGDQPVVSVGQVREWLDDFGLTCCATHRAWNLMRDETEAEVEFHRILGCDYTAIGMLPGDCYKSDEVLANWFTEATGVLDRLDGTGLTFAFHNHAIEFEPRKGGTVFERLVSFDSRLEFELDTYWADFGQASSVELAHSLGGRLRKVHIKDGVLGVEKPRMAPVGEGDMDWNSVLPALRAAGTEWFIVEQDDCNGEDPFECLARSFSYLAAWRDSHA